MNDYTWSLDVLYSGYQDKKFIDDFNDLTIKVEDCKKVQSNLKEMNQDEAIIEIVKKTESLFFLYSKLSLYTFLRQSVNTSDSETSAYLAQVSQRYSEASKTLAQFDRYIAQVDDLNAIIDNNEQLHEYRYYLNNIKNNGKHLLSDDVEEMIAKLDLSAGNAWELMHSYLTSSVEVEYNDEIITLSQVRNLAYEASQETRKKAYEAELAAYDKIKDAISFSLNNIKSQVNTITKARGFNSPLEYTLHQSHMKKETLDAMLSAMKDYMPYFHQYLKRKGELLGHKNGLPWYDLFAPIGEATTKKFSIEEAKEYLVEHFKGFANDLAEMVARAFDKNWIDFYPRNGKRGGAFCAGVFGYQQSRILTNFNGELGDVVTLAHELGHAYHNKMIENNSVLNADYSMPVAETASTFNENIIMNDVIDNACDQEKISLIENQLQDLTQVICDIYSRFLFESEVFERRQNEFLFSNQLEEIMIKAQKEAYGDGLDHNYLHPFMWVNKGHYYSSDLSFYNFPYAFGGLFARGLIVKYKELKDEFLPKYQQLLKATPIMDVEDVAKLIDIDLTSKDFWVSALETAKDRIQEFLELTNDAVK